MKRILHTKLGSVPWTCSKRKLRLRSTRIESGTSEWTEEPEYPRPVPAYDDDRSPAALQHERADMAKFCQRLPCVEKIDFVSPYERPWAETEYYHYSKHRAPLFRPRGSFRVKAVPQSYGMFPFYKFITKTHLTEKPLGYFYEEPGSKDLENNFGRVLQNVIREDFAEDELNEKLLSEQSTSFQPERNVQKIADHLVQTLLRVYGPAHPHILNTRVARKSRQESFWVRGGFRNLYDQEKLNDPIKRHRLTKISGDDRRRLGELSFCFREYALTSLRANAPLKEISNWDENDQENYRSIEPHVYNPRILGLWPETETLFQAPGFEPGKGESHVFPLLNIFDIAEMNSRLTHWGCDPAESRENLQAMAIAASFAPLVAHAHALGFNYLNDLTYPLVGQTMLLDEYGNALYAAYQLNTLDVTNEWREEEGRSNLCWTSQPVKLFEEDGDWSWNVDPKALRPFLNFALNRGDVGEEGIMMKEWTPYLRKGDGGPATEHDGQR